MNRRSFLAGAFTPLALSRESEGEPEDLVERIAQRTAELVLGAEIECSEETVTTVIGAVSQTHKILTHKLTDDGTVVSKVRVK